MALGYRGTCAQALQKPEVFYEMIEDIFPNLPKIELNARGAVRPGWEAWGNEVDTHHDRPIVMSPTNCRLNRTERPHNISITPYRSALPSLLNGSVFDCV